MGDILVIEDERMLADDICQYLQMVGHTAEAVHEGAAGLARVVARPPDLVVLDQRLPDMSGLELLRRLQDGRRDLDVIMVTGHVDVPVVVAALKDGAADFLIKPLALEELGLAIETVLRRRQVRQRLGYFRQREQADATIIGTSAAMRSVTATLERITASPALTADAPPTVLITGETGTGKDLVARVLHYNGPRQAAQFVRVNCTALPDQLVESELFGHLRGAFTDARSDKRGLFEVAEGGTLFLDEIGHMKLPLQAKLLSVLERRRFRPLGATHEKRANVHVIAATNRDLAEAVRAGAFRSDLYHRIRTLTVHLPPLRERHGDVVRLAEYFLELHAARFGIVAERFTPEALAALTAYTWPGNVRELSHTVESAVLMADDGTIDAPALRCGRGHAARAAAAPASIVVDFAGTCPSLEDIHHQVITYAVELTGGNYTRAADLLGITRDAIRYRLDKRNV